ncbi:amino acid ABC transporter membrane protein 2 (PAAT family) [Georgenia soli]|uniref:Amino acid ABC transporter membrane protein 2 (PAAT family) n=1 Tax=Georgenia soli TaxID=638953 RepID=A0A2A9EJN4_9MICO|nr:amino acid ABC transporter permease [Georgenia soli]PFG38439.1 amino acid ABC transporter membrane protein 2 (PAAT family) [Georgenia soli]
MSSVLFDAPGPRTRRRIAVVNVVGALVVLGVLAWVIWGLAQKGQLTAAKWNPFLTETVWADYLLVGLWNTLRAALIAIVTANAFGLLFGLGRLSQSRLVRGVCGTVVEFFRAVPVLIMMIFFWQLFSYVPGPWMAAPPFYGVVFGLTLYNGSVIAELVRSGVQNLPRGQREAALAIGLTRSKSLRLVEVPQALIAMMPSMVSQLVVILKDTALGYIITYSELLRSARLVGSTFANYVPALIVAAVIFIVINYTLTWLAELLARRLSKRTAGGTRPAELTPADAGE